MNSIDESLVSYTNKFSEEESEIIRTRCKLTLEYEKELCIAPKIIDITEKCQGKFVNIFTICFMNIFDCLNLHDIYNLLLSFNNNKIIINRIIFNLYQNIINKFPVISEIRFNNNYIISLIEEIIYYNDYFIIQKKIFDNISLLILSDDGTTQEIVFYEIITSTSSQLLKMINYYRSIIINHFSKVYINIFFSDKKKYWDDVLLRNNFYDDCSKINTLEIYFNILCEKIKQKSFISINDDNSYDQMELGYYHDIIKYKYARQNYKKITTLSLEKKLLYLQKNLKISIIPPEELYSRFPVSKIVALIYYVNNATLWSILNKPIQHQFTNEENFIKYFDSINELVHMLPKVTHTNFVSIYNERSDGIFPLLINICEYIHVDYIVDKDNIDLVHQYPFDKIFKLKKLLKIGEFIKLYINEEVILDEENIYK